MAIDWFTVLAQAINFLLLVWLLKRFLYLPILNALDAREQRIAKTLADAANKQKLAQQEREQFSRKNHDLEEQRNALLETAIKAAAAERRRLLKQAKDDADKLSLQQQKKLQQELHTLSHELSQKTQEEVFAITRQTLTDLANADLEEQIIAIFLAQLRELDAESQKTLSSALSTSNRPARVRSNFPLHNKQKKQIRNILTERFAPDIEVDFETSREIVAGIELVINGQKLAWNIAQYLESLEKNLQQLAQRPLQQGAENPTLSETVQSAESIDLQQKARAEKASLRND